jgi:hypothetical protein
MAVANSTAPINWMAVDVTRFSRRSTYSTWLAQETPSGKKKRLDRRRNG